MALVEKNFVSAIGDDFNPDPNDNVKDSIFKEYERVVFQSLITSFGLDFFIQDRHGGDVDTIHNVRQIGDGSGKDPKMKYKSSANESDYANRGDYKSAEHQKGYRGHKTFRQTKREAKDAYLETGQTVEDEYTGEDLHFLGNSKNAPTHINAELDHVIAAKSIHEDKGRVLSGLKGYDLANDPDNLKFTNARLNRSMGADEIPDYIERHPELPEDVKQKMLEHYNKSKAKYEEKLAKEYYTSPKFWADSGKAAASLGAKMGLRQALGFVLTEVWFAVKDALAVAGEKLEEKLSAISEGIKQGFASAKEKFGEVIAKFGEGAISGIISSLMTTLINTFATTIKSVVTIIRQAWASIVEATKILIFNPDQLPFDQRLLAATKILATGAAVVIGGVVQGSVHAALLKLPLLAKFPDLLDIIPTFAGAMCTGFLTVTFLYFIDNDPFGGFITKQIDNTIAEYKRQAQLFREYAAKLQQLNIEKFEQEAEMYHDLAIDLEYATNDDVLNKLLKKATEQLGIPTPWGENRSLNEFMNDKKSVLRFEA